jgi:hypothetical protein
MHPARKRLVYVSLAALIAALFVAGVVTGYVDRHSSICRDNKPPVAQQDTGLGQILFKCADGQVVTSND